MKSPPKHKDNLVVGKVRNLHFSGSQSPGALQNVKSYLPTEVVDNMGRPEKEKLYIGKMWSQRCKMMLRAVLDNLGLNYTSIKLGEVEIIGKLSPERQSQLNSDLLLCGLVLLDDHKLILVEKIKILIVEMIDYFDELPILNISSYLSQELHLNYIYLSNLFSENTDMSIQQFIISYKIEKAKELLLYDEYSLKEISYRLHYSSVAHLSNQFKKVTGLSPSQFKNVKYKT